MSIEIKQKTGQSMAEKLGVPSWRMAEINIKMVDILIQAYETRFEYTDLAEILVKIYPMALNESEKVLLIFGYGEVIGHINKMPLSFVINELENYKSEEQKQLK